MPLDQNLFDHNQDRVANASVAYLEARNATASLARDFFALAQALAKEGDYTVEAPDIQPGTEIYGTLSAGRPKGYALVTFIRFAPPATSVGRSTSAILVFAVSQEGETVAYWAGAANTPRHVRSDNPSVWAGDFLLAGAAATFGFGHLFP